MLYETLLHPWLLLVFFVLGVICGAIFDVGKLLKKIFINKKITNILFDFLCTSTCLALAFITNLIFNYGELRFFPVLICLTAFVVERFTLGKILKKIRLPFKL